MGKNNLEERLINFAVAVIEIAENLKKSFVGTDLSGQLIRSATSAAQNYGEAQSPESRKDFIHKIKVVLKELRETKISLSIVHRTKLYSDDSKIQSVIDENNELIAIFVASTVTASKNMGLEDSKKYRR
ncbi:MAG: four helix bundle protein [Saprospiraceae bacterium]|uniref:Four helix bundle protein n=1 Tax=Candidatus Opimibacter skivensis TaxID=2982028 RepID=A0A9D7SX15_9BACT|nr:four helix bundle protein [Candidatus Opimibacter skivensis]